MSKKVNPLLAAKIKQMAEAIGPGKQLAKPKKPHTTFRIPLEQLDEEGLNLSLSMTGAHLCIKI